MSDLYSCCAVYLGVSRYEAKSRLIQMVFIDNNLEGAKQLLSPTLGQQLEAHFNEMMSAAPSPEELLKADLPECCSDCGTVTAARSACPTCKKVFCLPCAEKPYASCCDGNAS